MKITLCGAALSWAAVCSHAQDPPPPAYGLPAASFDGTFGNVLGDRVRFDGTIDAVHATGRLGERDLRIDARAAGGGFSGTAQIGSGKPVPCAGIIDGEGLRLRVGDCEWRLAPEVELDASLADLGAPVVDDTRNWTVAIYLGGDNDLENAAVRDLLEMQRGVPAHGCEVIVLLDRHKDADDDAADWSDTRELRVRPGSGGSFETLGTPRERDTGNAATLASFVTGVFRKYPAKHHAVFVWDHGGGWTGICVDQDPAGAAKGRTILSLQGVRDGLRTALQSSGLLRLDLLAFDACLMAQLDVALAMHDLAAAMVASEATVPGTGFPYTKVLPRFCDDTTGRAIAESIVREYGSFSDDEFESGSTLCAFDLAQAPAVAARLDALAREAFAASGAQWRAIARALFYAECYEPRQERVADNAVGSIDLLDLAARLRGIPGIGPAALDALVQAVRALVVARYSGAERTLSQGLSIYGPHRHGQYDADYDHTPLGRGNAWRPLLQRVHELAAADRSEIAIGDFRRRDALDAPTTQARPFGGDRLLFTATGNSIVQVVVKDWQYDANAKNWLLLRAQLVTDPLWPARWATAVAADMVDLVMPQFQEGRNELFHELSGMTFSITDGAIQTYGSLDMSAASTQAPITAIARHTAKATGEQRLAEVAFDRAEWHVVSVRPIGAPAPGMAPRTLVPAAGDTFEFLLITRGEDGAEGGTFAPALTWGDHELRLWPEADDPGRYRAEMVARTIDGRTASGTHEYEVVANPDLAAWPDSWKGVGPSTLVGTWAQFKVTGPQQYQDLHTTCEVAATGGNNLFTVHQRGGPTGTEFETNQFWNFEWHGLVCLRVVTRIADGQKFGWYGPVRLFEKDGKRALAMKAVNASGIVWEWRQQ